ncbi:amidohydrolase family protein [Paenibacillus pasadenensis]|uniref:amidohydrolase family protein n=1 Tax=Paenibacillus pasadenensis TaxID=217090 RepID=UPI0004131FB9|nr:amidohydrolase family protein [Paenibacillus pasadenensis]
MTIPYDLLLTNARLPGGGAVDIGIVDGRIAAVGALAAEPAAAGQPLPEGSALRLAPAKRRFEAGGLLLLLPFAEAHVHLDTALTAGMPAWNESGTLAEGIGIWSSRRAALTREDVLERAERTLELYLGYGVLELRTMVDIGDPQLTALRAVLELKERWRDRIRLQAIAFPQDGIESCPSNLERMREALRLGADGVSAVPHLERTREEGVASLRAAFALAERSGAQVHLFCDETDDGQSRFLEVAASLALATGLGGSGRVAAAHANAAAYYNEPYFQKLLPLVRQSGLSIVACPLINSVTQGRSDGYPKGRGLTRIKEFHETGVNVALAHDDIRSPFYPLGTGNPLDAAHMAAHLAHMSGRSELRALIGMIASGARAAMGLGKPADGAAGLRVGDPASFLLFDALDESELIRLRPAPRQVFREGRLVAETVPAVTRLLPGGRAAGPPAAADGGQGAAKERPILSGTER